MKLTLDQAMRMVEVCPKGSYYYLEALRVVSEHGLERRVKLAIDSHEPIYRDINDDDGEGT